MKNADVQPYVLSFSFCWIFGGGGFVCVHGAKPTSTRIFTGRVVAIKMGHIMDVHQ